MKVCYKCKIEKSEADFSKWKLSKDGLQGWCKQCTNEYGTLEKRRERTRENIRKKRLDPKYVAHEREVDTSRRALYRVPYLLIAARKRAKTSGLEFSITAADIIIADLCPILKMPMLMHTIYAASIDRIDSTKGYIPGNVQVISRKANTMKSNATSEELLKFAQYYIKLHLIGQNEKAY